MTANSHSVHCRQALLPQGWRYGVRVAWTDRTITSVTEAGEPDTEDEQVGVAIPGLCNVHSHAFQRAMAGRAERRSTDGDSFWTWRATMYRFLEHLTPDDVRVIASQAYAEMLEAGFTRVGEFHYLHHDPTGAPYTDIGEMAGQIGQAAQASGIGLTLLPSFYAHGGFGPAPPHHGQRRFLNDLDRFARLMEVAGSVVAQIPGSNLGVAPHSLRAVTEAELDQLVQLAPEGPIHIHAAEQIAEVEACIEATGRSPVAWLLDHQPVDGRWCLIHATHVTGGEAERLAASGAVAGLCPLTEASLGDGVFPALHYVSAGGRFGIGSDSNILIDAATELRQLEYGQRLRHQARNVLALGTHASTGRALVERALAGGHQALGQNRVGLTVGAPADLVTLDEQHPAIAACAGDTVFDGMIFAARRPAVDRVWSGGRLVVKEGRHVNATSIGTAYAGVLRRLS